jgi:hypothetical protein
MMHARMRIAVLLTCVSSVLGTTVVALGQDRGARGSARSETTAPAAEEELEVEEGEEIDEDVDATAESDVVEVGGEQVKVFRFSGLDISGRLKSPQLLYFLNRLRAEFDRPRLPHRSFMPELERSAESKALR